MRYLLLVLLMVLTACGEEENGTTVDCSVSTNWTTVGAPFVYTWCTPCHSPSLDTLEDRQGAYPSVNFGTYDDVINHADRIEEVIYRPVGSAGTMPPGGGPSAEELDAVAEWIACGMPE